MMKLRGRDDQVEQAYQAYSKIVEQIIKEDTLVNQRITWGISINGGFFAFVITMFGLFKEEINTGNKIVILTVAIIIVMLTLIAMWISFQTYNGIRDARKQIYYIRDVYNRKWKTKVEEDLGLPRPFGSRSLFVEADGKPMQVSAWWGDNLILGLAVFWVIAIIICIIGVISYILFPFA